MKYLPARTRNEATSGAGGRAPEDGGLARGRASRAGQAVGPGAEADGHYKVPTRSWATCGLLSASWAVGSTSASASCSYSYSCDYESFLLSLVLCMYGLYLPRLAIQIILSHMQSFLLCAVSIPHAPTNDASGPSPQSQWPR